MKLENAEKVKTLIAAHDVLTETLKGLEAADAKNKLASIQINISGTGNNVYLTAHNEKHSSSVRSIISKVINDVVYSYATALRTSISCIEKELETL